MNPVCKVPLLLSPQPEGGYTVTSPMLPELLTEGDTLAEAMDNVGDALTAALELYQDMAKPLPDGLMRDSDASPISFEYLVPAP